MGADANRRVGHTGCLAVILTISLVHPLPTQEDDESSRATTPAPPSESPEKRFVTEPLPPARPYGYRQVAYDAEYLLRRPQRLERRDKRWLAAVGATTLGLYLLRHEIRDCARDHRSPGRQRFLQDARTMGKGAFAPALAAVAYASSWATKNEREKEMSLLLLESMIVSGTTALAGSFVLATERPEEGSAVRLFRTDGHGVSVDAALAASVVPPIRRQYLRVRPDDPAWKKLWKRTGTVLLYTGAGLVAYQRIDQDKHWAPDAFLGVMTGLAVGETLCDAHDEARRKRVRLGASAVPGGAALGLSIRTGRRPQRDPS